MENQMESKELIVKSETQKLMFRCGKPQQNKVKVKHPYVVSIKSNYIF